MRGGMLMIMLGATLACAQLEAATYNLVTQFNTSINPSASTVFSYGLGAAGSGSFTADGIANLNLACFGNLTACISNNTTYPNSDSKVWNGSGAVILNPSFPNVSYPTDSIQMDPQGTVGDIVRFTAPVSGIYSVSGQFNTQDTNHATTAVFVEMNNTTQLLSGSLGSSGSNVAINLSSISLTAGNTLDFVVFGTSGSTNQGSGLQGTITGPSVSGTPEPGTLALVGLILPAIWLRRRQ